MGKASESILNESSTLCWPALLPTDHQDGALTNEIGVFVRRDNAGWHTHLSSQHPGGGCRRTVSLRLAWATSSVQGQLGLHSETQKFQTKERGMKEIHPHSLFLFLDKKRGGHFDHSKRSPMSETP